MLKFLNRAKYPGLVFAISFLVLSFFFHEVLFAPNAYVFTASGDGIMNYYSFMYHTAYELNDFWNFHGMNYPYSEHVIYTGAHPVHSYVIGLLGLESYGVGILNLMMLISFPIASVFLYSVMRHYKVSIIWSIVAAVTITYFSPHIARLSGHLALTYAFAIPAMWWFLIKCRHGNGKLWGIVSFIYMMFFFMTHPYLGMILASMCALFWLITYFYNRSSWRDSAAFFSLQVVLPIVIFRAFIFFTDTHYGRIDEPSGFFAVYGSWQSVFAAHHGPIADFWEAKELEYKSWETWAYVGVSTMLFFVYILGYFFVRRKELPVKRIFSHELFILLIVGYITLIFSFCFPFKYDWARWITDYFGTLKQFRVLGRFAWIFFYVFTTGTVITLCHIYKHEGKRTLIAAFFFMGMAFMFVEQYEELTITSNTISTAKNTFKEENLSADFQALNQHLQENEYDAFIFLPFFHYSSENMMIIGEEQAQFDAYMLSYHSKLPMMNCLASRLSQPESIKFNNLFSVKYMEKEIIYDIPEKHKIALITNQDPLSEDEQRMVNTQEVEFRNNSFTLYSFDRNKWNTSEHFDQVKELQDSAKYKLSPEWSSTEPNVWFAYESWDEKSRDGMKGKGAFHGVKMYYDQLWVMPGDQFENGDYEMSFWYNHAIDRADLACFVEIQYKSDRGLEWADTDDLKESNEIVGQWLRGELNFTITEDVDTVKLFMAGNQSRKPYIVDELLVRKVDDPPLLSKGKLGGKEYIIYNNYWLWTKSFQPK